MAKYGHTRGASSDYPWIGKSHVHQSRTYIIPIFCYVHITSGINIGNWWSYYYFVLYQLLACYGLTICMSKNIPMYFPTRLTFASLVCFFINIARCITVFILSVAGLIKKKIYVTFISKRSIIMALQRIYLLPNKLNAIYSICPLLYPPPPPPP